MHQAAHPLSPLLRKLGQNHVLDEADEAAILALPHVVRRIERDKTIVRERDKPTHSCLVVSGFAIRHKIMGSGARQILNVHVAGDMVDLQNSLLAVADHNVQALTTMSAAFIPREAVVEVAYQRPTVGKALWLETLIEGSIARENMANVGRRDSRTRIAHLLCEFAVRLEAAGLGEQCNYELPMTQEQIGDTVGLTAVHVNRTLRALEAKGLIRRNQRSVVIDDWQKLADVGDFEPTYLHMQRHNL